MTQFRLDVSRESGKAMLWMATGDTACGYRPVLAWPSMEGVREFAHMLLAICGQRDGRRNHEDRFWGRGTGADNGSGLSGEESDWRRER